LLEFRQNGIHTLKALVDFHAFLVGKGHAGGGCKERAGSSRKLVFRLTGGAGAG
jgi:hypothetical protein